MTAQTVEFPGTATPRADGRSGPEVPTALICDTPLLRSGLHRILFDTPFALVEDSPMTDPRLGSGKAREPALVILAVGQPSGHTPKMIQQVKAQHPAARIAVLAERFDPEFLRQGLDAGVNGFCLTSSSREVLIISLELAMLGESILVGPVARSIIDSMALSPEPEPASKVSDEPKVPDPRVQRLSAREAEILSSLMEGAPNKIIARKLDVAEATVKVHIKAILRKIRVTNRTQAAMWAMNHIPARAESSLRE
jgi:two-component system nitrate/nitrite response regulator NarL